ncbi:MAG TPA: signal recognition particle-docking protein FtsY [Pyrinomonadaceae bacterium]|nr:signal recognition particle-docking protein FtsY [Pyrinomonadaceae bacterium]
MAFWRRKSKDQFITLGLNEPATPARVEERTATVAPEAAREELQTPAALSQGTAARQTEAVAPPSIEPTPTGGGPTPLPANETQAVTERPQPATPQPAQPRPVEPVKPVAAQKPVPSRSTFSSSILGLDRSIEELQAQEDALEQEFATRFRRAVASTRESLSEKIDTIFQGRKQIDAELLDELEEALIAADIGVPTTLGILESVRMGIARQQINDIAALKDAIKSELMNILKASETNGVNSETSVPETVSPYVMMIVGVNGVGKTTTIGKLAQRIKAEGNDVLICAADTFRAAASDQLAIWAERTGVPLIQQKQGTDPAAVLFDSLKAAKARSADVLIVDTAGRLHNKSNLMAELEKMKRIAGREVEGAPHETLLVIDAVTGQNGLEQARQFLKVAGVTGIVLTKLDGTAKGGIAVAIAKELNLPIRYAGIGEKVDDLVVFDPEQYVNSLFE